MAGLTPSGFEKKTLSEIKAEMEAALRLAFGNFINLLPASVFGTLVGILSERESLIWDLAEEVYNSQYPDTAEGVNLANAVALTGTVPLDPVPSRIFQQEFLGDPGTFVAPGFTASQLGNPDVKFVLDDGVTLDGLGEATGTMTCTEDGPTPAFAGSISVIDTPVSGLDSTSNLTDAVPGRSVETDPELRLRRQDEITNPGSSTLEAMRVKLKEVMDVAEAIVFENDQDVEVDGRPPHSIEAFVDGGLDQDIGERLWRVKPGGIRTFGDVEVNLLDSQGLPQTVFFSRPVQKDVWVELNLTKDPELYPIDGDDQIKALIIEYGSRLRIGEDVLVYPKLLPSFADEIDGLLDIQIFVGFAVNPVLDDNLAIAVNEIAKFDTSRIEINTV